MGMLMNFLGGAAKSLAGSIDQDRLEKKRIEDEQRQHEQQVSWAKAALALQINTKTKTAIPAPSPLGAPIKDASGNWVQPTQIESGALVDDELNVTRPAAMLPGPSVPTTDPNAPTQYQAAMLEQKQLDRDARIEAAKIRGSRGGGSSRAEVGEDGLTAYQREQLKRTDAREARLGKQSGKGGERPDNVRKAWDEEAARTAELEGEALRSKAAQYGMDQRGLPTDDETLRSALMAQIDAQYGKRLESASKRGGDKQPKPDKPDDESPPIAGAKKAPDGFWYVQKNGKWFKVD